MTLIYSKKTMIVKPTVAVAMILKKAPVPSGFLQCKECRK